MTKLKATITNVSDNGNTVLHSALLERTGTFVGNLEMMKTWAAANGHPVERVFGRTLSGKAQDGILVKMEAV